MDVVYEQRIRLEKKKDNRFKVFLSSSLNTKIQAKGVHFVNA